MPISERTRKVLWARSGNRCAVCRRRLVVDKSDVDHEVVVGEECHIVSGAKGGPRYDPAYPESKIDSLSNLVLLCRVHHKVVDDQVGTYPTDKLSAIKAHHEEWVEKRLVEQSRVAPIRWTRISSEVPKQLYIVTSGKKLLDMAIECDGAYHDYNDGLDEEETEQVGGVIQNITDWGSLGDRLEPIEQVRAAQSIEGELAELRSKGFLVFAARERQRIEGGITPPASFYVLHISVLRESDPRIIGTKHEGV